MQDWTGGWSRLVNATCRVACCKKSILTVFSTRILQSLSTFIQTSSTMDVCESTPLVGPSTNTHHDSRTTGNNERKNDTYKRRLGLLDGVALVLGLQIGSGIFASPSLVVRRAGSELAALAIWCCAGILTWACAACYIELGTRMPVNGGPQEYISNNLNELTGLFAAYGCIFIIKPSSAAILALVIAEYLCAAFSLEGRFVQKLASLCIVAAITTVNCLGNRISGLTTKAFLACKVIAISAVILAGLVVLICPGSHDHLGNPQYRSRKLSDYADATLSAMWSYSGWETVRETSSPARQALTMCLARIRWWRAAES